MIALACLMALHASVPLIVLRALRSSVTSAFSPGNVPPNAESKSRCTNNICCHVPLALLPSCDTPLPWFGPTGSRTP